MLKVLEDAPMPAVAAVNGGALGGGFEVVLTCDMILVADIAGASERSGSRRWPRAPR
jgi:enoyl-CoA hydratase/carnithine racemase